VDFKLVWTESATDDLGAIVRYVTSESSAEIGKKAGFGIYDRVQILERFPESGSVLPEKDDFHWRKLIHKSWKIAYLIDFDLHIVYIARIWHASQDEVEIPEP
jgi:toxin ParE1/3/4